MTEHVTSSLLGQGNLGISLSAVGGEGCSEGRGGREARWRGQGQ